MANFVDKVKKNGVEYEIHDTEGRVKIDGTSLVVPEQSGEGPEPVGEFDGVKYYYKQEFDLEEISQSQTAVAFDILTGEPEPEWTRIVCYGNGQVKFVLQPGPGWGFILYDVNDADNVNYTSRSLIVTHDTSDITSDNTKIYLPGNITEYYGWLSEDGKTFISYYNLKPSGPEFIDSIKQGNAVISLRTGGSGGTPLYNHHIKLGNMSVGYKSALDSGETSQVAIDSVEVDIVTNHATLSESFFATSCVIKIVFNSAYDLYERVSGYVWREDIFTRIGSTFVSFGGSSGPSSFDAGFYILSVSSQDFGPADTVTPL